MIFSLYENHYEKSSYMNFSLNFHIWKFIRVPYLGTLGYNKFFILFVEE